MFFFKQLGIAIVILVILSVIIHFMNNRKKKEGFEFGNSNPYGTLDYVANPNGLNSSVPIQL